MLISFTYNQKYLLCKNVKIHKKLSNNCNYHFTLDISYSRTLILAFSISFSFQLAISALAASRRFIRYSVL